MAGGNRVDLTEKINLVEEEEISGFGRKFLGAEGGPKTVFFEEILSDFTTKWWFS